MQYSSSRQFSGGMEAPSLTRLLERQQVGQQAAG